ncbi:MAG: hypothetical protein KAI74_07405 [Kiritimatiellae bacterium]|nr:hypothetical protein [Kiritimatiellia bacterium]
MNKSNKQTSAWMLAEEYGCDMSLLETNLRKSPSERIKAHQHALNTALMLRKAMEKHHARDGYTATATN